MQDTTLESKSDVAVANIQEAMNALILRIEELERENEMLKGEIASKISLN